MIVANFFPVQTSHQTYAESDAKFNGVKKKIIPSMGIGFCFSGGAGSDGPRISSATVSRYPIYAVRSSRRHLFA